MKNLFNLIGLSLLFASVAFSQSEKLSPREYSHVKVLDGHEAKCDSYNEDQVNTLHPLAYKMLSVTKNGSQLNAIFEISYLTCKNNKWLLQMANQFSYQYKDSVGQVISENIQFRNEKILVKDKDNKILDSVGVVFNPNSPVKVHIKINSKNLSKDPITGTKYVDLVMVAEKIKKNPADFEVSEVNWGNYRFHISNNLEI